MKISFVIPAYNEEDFIGPCLDSVLSEIRRGNYDAEVIVVNNASTDKTREVVLKYPQVKLIDEPKQGLTWARQAGYLVASGDLIANVDADNRLTSDWIETVLKEFTNSEELVALSGPLEFFDLPKWANIEVRIFYGLGYATYLVNNHVFKKAGMLQGGNFVIKKTALDKIGGYNTDVVFYGEDTDAAVRLRKCGKIKFTFDLKMSSSGRRLKKEGVWATGFKYALNYFWVLFFKRPFHR